MIVAAHINRYAQGSIGGKKTKKTQKKSQGHIQLSDSRVTTDFS